MTGANIEEEYQTLTPLWFVMQNQHSWKKLKTLEVLLCAGANVEHRQSVTTRPLYGHGRLLHAAVGFSIPVYPTDMAAAKVLLEHGALIDEEVAAILPPELLNQYSTQRG